jgi:SRSO17 transposase
MLPGERKSVEPMAARTARTAAQHQSLLHFVNAFPWSDEKVLTKVREMVLPAMEKAGSIEPGSSTTRCLPRRASIRLACTTNIAASSASRPVAKWQ